MFEPGGLLGPVCKKCREGKMRKILFWIVWNIPLGKLAPYVLGLALGRMPQKKEGD